MSRALRFSLDINFLCGKIEIKVTRIEVQVYGDKIP